MLLVIQPWFTSVGHPAQSLLNTASILGKNNGICYLISRDSKISLGGDSREKLKAYGEVEEFLVRTPSLREGTLKGLIKISQLAWHKKRFERIFFFDAHLVLLAGVWPFFSLIIRVKKLSVLYLMGPERIRRSRLATWLVTMFLLRSDVTLYLRTEELVDAWKKSFPNVSASRIRHLPSLEIPDSVLPLPYTVASDVLRFGVLGQIRHGKSLDWLVPLFQHNPELGRLTVAGTFNNNDDAETMAFLRAYDGFQDGFLSDEELIERASQQDYLLMLYDNWDARMESAVLYLAARVKRPVIAYDKGWCGRQLKQYKNGLLAPENHMEMVDFFKSLPRPDSQEYDSLLNGVEGFRKAYSADALRENYLLELMN